MEFKKRLTTVNFSDAAIDDLAIFCQKCGEHGYKNNDSFESMRLEWCLNQGGQFFLTYLDNKIISVSGCHPLPQVGRNVYRILFRGATLPKYQNYQAAVSKSHMNSIPFYYHIPRALKWAEILPYDKFVITTNFNNPKILSMNKSHKVLSLLKRQGIVSCLVEKMDLFYTEQAVWKLNVAEYFSARNLFKIRHELDD